MTAACLLDFSVHADSRGQLVALEFGRGLPFDLKRAFYVYGVPGKTQRGGHCHKRCHEVLIALSGSVTVRAGGRYYYLKDPDRGLYIPPGIESTQTDFSPDCILLVLASEHYDPSDNENLDE